MSRRSTVIYCCLMGPASEAAASRLQGPAKEIRQSWADGGEDGLKALIRSA